MPANPWELRADTRPLELAAQRWTELADLMAHRAQDLVVSAARMTDGWDAVAAESYDLHRREVLMNLDRFTTLAQQVAGSLRAVVEIMTAGQEELDQAWTSVALVPHEVVGESRYLVFRPDRDEDRSLVTRAQAGAEEIRGRLTTALDQESERLRVTGADLVRVRSELADLDRGAFPTASGTGTGSSGIEMVAPGSTSVPGSAQGGAGAAGLTPIGPIAVDMPDLTGISGASGAGLGALGAAAAGGLLGAARRTRSSAATPPLGGMGAGAMGARAGTMSRGMASGRAGARRLPTPRLDGPEGEEARAAREKAAAKEAKQAALEEKRAERAARRAERAARREEREAEQRDDGTADEAPDEAADDAVGSPEDGPADRPARITVVEHVPGEAAGEPRR